MNSTPFSLIVVALCITCQVKGQTKRSAKANQPAREEKTNQPAKIKELKFSKNDDPEKTVTAPTVVHLKIPKGFKKMTSVQLHNKFDGAKEPLQAYTDYHQAVDIFVTESPVNFPIEDLEFYHDFFRSSLTTIYDDIEWVEEQSIKMRGKQFMKIAFIGLLKAPENNINKRTSQKKYYIYYYTFKDGKRINVSMAFPASEKEEWLAKGEKMMKSIRL